MKKVNVLKKEYQYSISQGIIRVDDKYMKLRGGSNFVYKLNKTCITCESQDELRKFIEYCISEQFMLCNIKTIFDYVLENGGDL